MSKKVSFKFIPKTTQELVNSNYVPNKTTFYQLAMFPCPKGYHIRRFIINEQGNFENIANKFLSEQEHSDFIQNTKQHKYKQYSTFDLNEVNYPSAGDVALMRSDILN